MLCSQNKAAGILIDTVHRAEHRADALLRGPCRIPVGKGIVGVVQGGMHGQMGRLFQHHRKCILIDHVYRDLRLRGHAFPFRRQLKADRLPRVHPSVGKNRLSIRKKAAAPELDCTGKVGRNGTLAQKIAQKHSVLGLQRIGHRKKQPHMHPHLLRKKHKNV